MAWLIVISKDVPPSIFELGEGWVTIGRGEGNGFQIVETSISARHCEICVHGEDLLVRDLVSTNGTFVSGRRIAEAVVRPGGTLRLGDVEFRYTAGEPPNPVPNTLLLAPRPVAQEIELFPSAEHDPDRPFQVLFVDDSLAFLELFGELCVEFSARTWNVYKAASASAALGLLNEVMMDLVVLDVGLPMMDGLQLLAILNRRYPGLKIAVITGKATPERRAQALAQGAELFLEKPVTADGLTSIFKMLEELLLWKHDGFTGALRQVNLQEILHVECGGRHSSILEIHDPKIHGEIYIDRGAIIHAVAGELTGEPAFHRLLALRGGEFQVRPFRTPAHRTIDSRWEFLLMDTARVASEDTVFLMKNTSGGHFNVGHPNGN
jgi:CheY-like chemotaxis protein